MGSSLSRRSVALISATLAASMLAAACGSDSKKTPAAASGSPSASTSASAPVASASDSASAPAEPAPAASSTSEAAPSGEPVTLKVGLFGTFGYKEAGLYDEYMKLHPNVKIEETSITQESSYYPALQTHLAGGSGLSDIQGVEVGRIADVTQNQADKWVDLNTLGAESLKDGFFAWKWAAATTKDGKTLGLGTDTGPLAMCYRRDLFAKAGLPTDRTELAARWKTWDDFLAFGKEYQAKADGKSAFHDSSRGLYNTVLGQSADQYYDASGALIHETNPAVKSAWETAAKLIANGQSAKFEQFSDPWNAGFSNGAFATLACPAWMIGYIEGQDKAVKEHWDVTEIPGGGGNWGGAYLSIPKASKHHNEAFELAKWLTAPEQQVKMWTTGQHFPSSSVAAQDPAVASAADPDFNNAPIGEIFAKSAGNLTVQILGTKDGDIKTAFNDGLTLIEQGGTPEEAWKSALASVKDLTDK